jgi:hypothetical protein
VVGTTTWGKSVRSAIALPSPMADPPPTATTASAPSRPTSARARLVTATGVCAAASLNRPAQAGPRPAAIRSAPPR